MQCPSCASPVEATARFCPACGSSTDATTPMEGHGSSFLADLTPGTLFAGRYRIVERAGAGGMGVVYRAVDQTLGETVALKLIRPELAHVPQFVERFKREVKITRQINHPNVCRVFDIGESDGVLFLSMAWVSGETLSQRLARVRGRRLPREEALRIGLRIARALGAVHAKGVIHRDLKPGNVMLDDRGEVHVMDFGLALEARGGDSTLTLGQAGTPAYMAPEHRRGEELDPRADLYALGLILREMLSGERPDRERGLVGDPRGGMGGGLGRLLSRLTAADATVRPVDATEVAGEIARLRSEVSLREKLKGHMQRHPQWSAGLAVLFTLLVAGGAYWGMGRLLETPAPSEAETYYGRGLHYLREESETVRSVDDAILQFHRAIQADSLFAPAWAGMAEAYWSRYTLDRRDASMAEAIQVEARAVELGPDLAETRVARARGLYARGDYEGVEPALGNASRDREVGYMALGYAGLAHLALGEFDEAEKDLEEAVRRRPDSHRSWLYLGKYHQDRGEYPEAAAAFQEAADLKPDSPYAWANLGASLLYQGRFEDAIPPLERSLRIDENAVARTNLGTAYYSLGDLDRAIEHYRIAAKSEPYRGIYWANLGDALITADRATEAGDAYQEAVAAGLETVRLTPGNMAAHSLLGLWAARVGDRRTAFEHAGLAVDAQNRNPSFIFNLAVVNVIFGEDEEGLGLLRKAVVEMGVSRSDLDLEPAFERLRDDDRFRAIYDLSS